MGWKFTINFFLSANAREFVYEFYYQTEFQEHSSHHAAKKKLIGLGRIYMDAIMDQLFPEKLLMMETVSTHSLQYNILSLS